MGDQLCHVLDLDDPLGVLEEALDALRSGPPDLMILDLMLPGQSGLSLFLP